MSFPTGTNQRTTSVKDFVNKYTNLAKQASEKMGTDYRFILAQWGLETGYGNQGANTWYGNYNLAGSNVYAGASTPASSSGKYQNIFQNENEFLTHWLNNILAVDDPKSRYANTGVFGAKSIDEYAKGLELGGYAPNQQYKNKLKNAFTLVSKYATGETSNITNNSNATTDFKTALTGGNNIDIVTQKGAFWDILSPEEKSDINLVNINEQIKADEEAEKYPNNVFGWISKFWDKSIKEPFFNVWDKIKMFFLGLTIIVIIIFLITLLFKK